MAAAVGAVRTGYGRRIEPLLPVVPRRADHPGRRRLDGRKVLCGVLFVLYTGIPWEFLPQELGFGSGMTCWRRLRDWHEAGVWQQLHEALLAELHAAGELDWSRAVVDGSHVRAMKGGARNGPEPGRPCPARLQAPRDRRSARHPAGGVADRRQPQRRHPAHAPDPGHPARPGLPRTAPAAARTGSTLTAATTTTSTESRSGKRASPPVIARRGTEHGSAWACTAGS